MHFYDWFGACHNSTDSKFSHIPENQVIRFFLEEGYLPSATTILSVVRHSDLERYKIKLALDHYAAHRNYQQALGYEDDTAATKGKRLHRLCEQLFQNFIHEKL